ncbi:hypothetical protein AUP68_00331 [Ilyonectria robusta]
MQAYHRKARQIWVFNVGDLKPLEIPMTFAMALAWNVDNIPSDGIQKFLGNLAERQFGQELSADVSSVWHGYDRLASLRKHEHIEPDTFSLLHYNEAEIILHRWKDLLDRADALHRRTTPEQKAASFQLILHPVKASYIYVALQIMRAKNQLYARQRRNSANKVAQTVLDLFDEDFDLSEEFHALLDGKWNHMLMQTHYGYEETWHAPSRDMISGLCYVQRRQNSNPIVGQMGVAIEGHEGVRPGRINEESERTHPSRRDLVPGVTLGLMSRYGPEKRWFEIFTRGTSHIHWSASAPYPWMKLSVTSGTLVPGEDDARVDISVDWSEVPESFDEETLIVIRSEEGDLEHVHLPITGRRVPNTFQNGFVEGCGYVSIPATGCDIKSPYIPLPDAGRLESGSVALQPSFPKEDETFFLTYPFYLFSEPSSPTLLLYFATTLDFSPEDILSYDLKFDDGEAMSHRLQKTSPESDKNAAELGWPAADDWFFAASDNVWVRKHEISGQDLKPGKHLLQIKLRHANMMLEKLVVDCGAVSDSYIGPPSSAEVKNGENNSKNVGEHGDNLG